MESRGRGSAAIRWSWIAAVGSALFAVPGRARAAGDPLVGTWECPLGLVRIEQHGDHYAGTLVQNSKICRFSSGTEVLRGSASDGTFTGEVRLCPTARICQRDAWALALLLVPPPGDNDMHGSLMLDTCASATLTSPKLEFRRMVETNHHSSHDRFRDALKEGQDQLDAKQYRKAITPLETAARGDDAVAAPARYGLARVYAYLGDHPKAYRWLHDAVAAGFSDLARLDGDEELKTLRRESEFRDIRNDVISNRKRAGRR
jgi:hypothetical protein